MGTVCFARIPEKYQRNAFVNGVIGVNTFLAPETVWQESEVQLTAPPPTDAQSIGTHRF